MITQQHIQSAEEEFKRTLAHLKSEYAKLQIGRANASLVEDIKVEAYGSQQPFKGLASISIPDPKTLQIQPWDKSLLGAIEKAILQSNLGLTPINDGRVIRLVMPPLTEERRKELAKAVHRMAEDARIAIRNSRGAAHGKIRQEEKDKLISEDDARLGEKHLQEKVDQMNKEIEELAKRKEQDIMTV